MAGATAAGPAAAAERLTKRYGSRAALRGVDLRLPWGSALVVLGPNGAGKTTLLRALAGLTRPSGGSVQVAGVDVRRDPARARTFVGAAMHQTFLYDDLTIGENLRFFARLHGLGASAATRAAEAAEALGIAGALETRVRVLSHGMQRRAALARATLHRPPLLLLDEPDTGLDQSALAALRGLISTHTAAGGSVILTTHSIEAGLSVADRVAVLHTGRIAYDAPSADTDASALRAVYADVTGGAL